MALLDFNVALGRFASPAGGAFDTPDHLLGEMDRLGIDEALVYHALAAEGDIELGNRLVAEQLLPIPRLYTCWVMAPTALGDLPEPAEWVRRAVAMNVRAVRLFPRHSLYGLEDWVLGPLADELEEAELPLILDFGAHHWSQQVIPWKAVHALSRRHSRMPVAVAGVTVGETRDLAAVLRACPNLYAECHAFSVPGGLARMAQAGLGRQLLFGTGMPKSAGECPVAQWHHSGLRSADRLQIGAENARRLLCIEEPAHVAEPVDMGAASPPLVIDVHGHYGCWERTITTARDAAAITESMQRCGINKLVGSSFTAIHGEMRLGNDQTAETILEFPERLYGYCAINPHYPSEIQEELHRCFEHRKGFAGLKFHCMLHEAQLHHPGYEAALAYADEHELPVLVHAGGKDDLAGVCERYPGASIILAHGCAWDGFDEAGMRLYSLVRDLPNLYVDVAGSAVHRGALQRLISLVSPKKVLYGSDFPMFDFAFELGRITLSGLSFEEKTVLCNGNALRLFKRLAP